MRRLHVIRIAGFLLIALLCSPGTLFGQSTIDRAALMDLYNSTNGANWTNNTNWGTAAPINDWYGVTQADASGEFARIVDLRNNNLTGQLPTTWGGHIVEGGFQYLATLILDQNNISGGIPPEISQITSLQILSINENNLSGMLPPELSELSNLIFLSFFGNTLSGSIPEAYYFMPNLATLQLIDNQLEGQLPTGLGQNDVLQNLRLGFNQLTGTIPPDIADGASIRVIALAYNSLTGTIPTQLGGNPDLVQLDLGGNLLAGSIPAELGTLTGLSYLRLRFNDLTGPIPSELGNLSQVVTLDLGENLLTGDVPASFTGLANIENLFLETNEFTSIPDLSGLSSLSELRVYFNFLDFEDLLPNASVPGFQYSPQFAYDAPQTVEVAAGGSVTLDASPDMASGNQYQWMLDGSPVNGATGVTYQITGADQGDAGVYTLTVMNPALPELTLTSANITVNVGSGSGQTIDRDALMALYNSTEGDNWTNNTNWGSAEPISEWFGITVSSVEPGRVETIDLRNNNLQGPFPSVWQTMIVEEDAFPILSNLLLSENGLTGAIPPQIGLLTSLRSISLGDNQLASQIPVVFGDLTNLVNLSLGFNQLSGSIPTELGQLTSLESLLLNNNALSGSLPSELGDLTNLVSLRVDQNELTGDVPVSLATLPNLRELFVQTNFFENLPDFSATPSLEILNAQVNLFHFDDLEPNTEVPNFIYFPQRRFGESDTLSVEEGGEFVLSFAVGGSSNSYQWYLDSTPVEGATSSEFQVTSASLDDEGSYTLLVTSSLFPILVLESNALVVEVTPSGNQGNFVVTNTNDAGDGSLRAAIQAANATANEQGNVDEITFDIPGTGPHVIRPQSPLPVITEPVSINGTTQPGANCGETIADRDLRIILDGSQAGSVEGGLVVRDNQNTTVVTGLVINGFSGAGVLIDNSRFASIRCNIIGADVTGLLARPNTDGVHIIASDNTFIGSDEPSGNLISGNSGSGIRIDGQSQGAGTAIYGNLIGTDRTGSEAIPNSTGVLVQNALSSLIGDRQAARFNVISGNSVRGIEVRGADSEGTFLTNNRIGSNLDGTLPVPNGEGIRVHDGGGDVTIGIETDLHPGGYTNLIAFNAGAGIVITGASSRGNRINLNRMFENDGLGIDLGDDGLNVNDIGDGDEGPNRLLNSPQIVSTEIDGNGDLIVSYLVESDGTGSLRIEFFEADADGEEGASAIGVDTYFLNEAGEIQQFNFGNAAVLGVTTPDEIVATATDSFGNTSEFSGAGSGPGGSDQITVTEPQDLDAITGGNVQVQATLPSGFNATVREVCYRRTGEAAFTCSQLQASGNDLEGAIPSSFVTARGVQYYFRFSDGTTERTVPETDPENSAFVLPVRVTSLRVGGSFAPDTYRMISIPVDLLDGSFANVLDEYGEFDQRRWRLLRWEPTLQDYAEFPDGLTGGFDPCEAYWLITFGGGGFEVENGQSVDPTQPCFVTVRPGWNQFGSPYAFPVAWSDVNVSGAVDGPVAFDASQGEEDPYRYNVEVLEPWQGYWLFNPGSSNVFMSFNPVEATNPSGKNRNERLLSGDEYEVRLRAVLPRHGLVDSQNRVGFSDRAAPGFDDLDFAEAPPIGDHVRLSILENDMRLAGSFRPDGGSGQSWDIEISGAVDGAPARGVVRVSLDEFGRQPSGFDMRVVDLDMQQPVRVDADGFEVELTGDHPVRRLRLIIGTAAFSEEAGESIPENPQRAELAQNYPNPFNPSTRIRYQVHVDGPIELAVFDPLGRRIRTLVDGNREPGWYDTVWNGRDESGTAVSSGLYFYVLTTTDGSVSRTMVLLR